jgi:hypothetical protein
MAKASAAAAIANAGIAETIFLIDKIGEKLEANLCVCDVDDG